jgi:hypothetical protein
MKAFGRVDIVINKRGRHREEARGGAAHLGERPDHQHRHDTPRCDHEFLRRLRRLEGAARRLHAQSTAYATQASVAKRLGKIDDIVPVVEFLASAKSQWVTAQTLFVNGGYLTR